MQISRPPVVASDGLKALRISRSGFAPSSDGQNAISSQIAATHVMPRTRGIGGWPNLNIDLGHRLSVSEVAPSTRSLRFMATPKMPSTKAKADAACWVDAGREISRQGGHSAGLPASAANELLDRLQRLALAAREACEDGALVSRQRFTADRDQQHAPRHPTGVSKKHAEVSGALQCLAHRNELAPTHRRGSLM